MQSTIRYSNPDDDFSLCEKLIPMRDGALLRTLILTPNNLPEDVPILLLRTPYDATKRLRSKDRTALHSVLGTSVADIGTYIFAFQDLRGRNGSTGDFEISRLTRGEHGLSETDESTDAFDTIAWLVEHVPRNNGRLAIYGTSYAGWTSLMALLDPHPALRAAVPANPLVDAWIGDDWFHNGAFRLSYAFEFVHCMESDPKAWSPFAFNKFDTYDWWLSAGSAGAAGDRYLSPERHRFWQSLTKNPEYSDYWQARAVDRLIEKSQARQVPTMHVHSWFDQEDIYGAPVAYAAMQRRYGGNGMNFLVAGPWSHGQNWLQGSRLGSLEWHEDTARRWRREQLAPFLAHYLKDGPEHGLAPVTVFNTGARRWERLERWPNVAGSEARSIFLSVGNGLTWEPSHDIDRSNLAYISDPLKPVPYQPRPVRRIMGDEVDMEAWNIWLTGDQRFVDGRPDVLTFVGEPLVQPVTVRGEATAILFAETTGTDADWIVKLIDVFPDLDAEEPRMSGFQLMVSGEILRGRYRKQFERAEPLVSGEVLEYEIRLPQLNHTFECGHKIMVQIQSSWFPLYDRNPQIFVENIMAAKSDDYREATHRVYCCAEFPSRIVLQVNVDGC